MSNDAAEPISNCLMCGKPFTPKRYWQRFHADHCRQTFHTMTRRRYMDELAKARLTAAGLQTEIDRMKSAAAARIEVRPYGRENFVGQ